MAVWPKGRQGNPDPSVGVWERIRSHVPAAPTAPAREHLASALPTGAGADVADVVSRLRPVEPEDVLVLQGAELPARARRTVEAQRAARRRVRRAGVAIATTVAMTLGATGAMPAAALVVEPGTIPGDTFEQDGNFVPNDPNKTDWTSANVQAVVVNDPLIPFNGGQWDSAFQGSSKEEDPANWTCQAKEGGVTPGKDNLLRAYVSTRFASSTAYLDLGLVKQEGEGDTHVNFEFNKAGQPVGEALNGACPITRSVGDFLVAYDFGGTSTLEAEVRLFTWGANKTWNEVTTGFTAKAANNTVAIADDPMVAGTQFIEPRTFAEVTIRLPENFLTCPGFAFVNVRSRSSHSIDSALQDKMPGTQVDLSTCGTVIIQKNDELGAPLAGATFGLFSNAQATGNPVKTCVSDAQGTCTFSQVTPGNYWIKEVSSPTTHNPDPDIVPVTVTFRSTTTVSLPFVNPLIVGNLLIRKTHSLGGPVAGVRFFLLQNGVPSTRRNGLPAECTTGADGTCRIDGLVPGTYTVREDAATVPSSMTAVADKTVTIVGNTTVEVAFVNPVKPIDIALTKTVNDAESVTVHTGDALTYKLLIKNTGQLPLTLTSLADVANGSPVSLPAGCTGLLGTTLAPNATTSCTYGGPAAGDVDNKATVVGTDEFNRTATAEDTAEVDVINPAITLTKTVNGAESVTVHAGDATTYVITFKNTGDTPLKITSLADVANGTPLTLPSSCASLVNNTPLAPNGTRSCTYTSTAPAGGVSNTATVVGEDALGGPKGTVTANDTAVVKVIDPAISLVKTVNGGESATVHQGDDLVYEITFTNDGDTPLTITGLSDVANGVTIDLPKACDDLVNATPLEVGASRSCTYTATAGSADVTNTATVNGKDALDEPVSASDDARVDVIHPLISIVKKVNGQDSVKAHEGDTVTYSLLITNTGDTPLEITDLVDVAGGNTVTLSDQCLGLVGDTLAAGASVSCEYTGEAPADDLTNTATVTGVDDLGGEKGTVKASDSAVVDVIDPDVALTKLVNGKEAVTVHEGDRLTYTVTIENTGDTPLTITSFGDEANGVTVDLPDACDAFVGVTLQPTETRVCTYTADATAADVHNVATVVGEDELGESVDAEDFADVTVISPAIRIVKTVNGDDEGVTVHEGDDLTYVLTITNIGDTPLTITALTDVANGTNVALSKECIDLLGDSLAIDASVSCSYSAVATAEDVSNVAEVVGEDELDKSVTDDDDADVDVINPAIDIVKTVNGEDEITVHAGDELTYELAITNTGDTDLVLTDLVDEVNGTAVALAGECADLVGTILAVDATVTCEYETVAGAIDITNVATVTGEDELEKEVEADDDAKVDVINPAIQIVKTVNGADSVKVHAGDELTYKLVITNTGDTAITLSALDDVANGAAVSLPSQCTSLLGTVVDVAASVECTYTAIASTADVTNVATTTGDDELGKKVTDDDDAKVDVLNPAIQIVKTADPTEIQGTSGTATFTYVVTNVGDTALLNVVVTDDILGEIGRIARLEVGASQTLTKTAAVSQAAPVNVGTATGEDELGKKVTDDDDASITFVRGVVVERPAPPAPAPPAPAPAPLPRTGAGVAAQIAAGLMLIVIGGVAVVPNRRRTLLGSA